jgi:hypothetical protein
MKPEGPHSQGNRSNWSGFCFMPAQPQTLLNLLKTIA